MTMKKLATLALLGIFAAAPAFAADLTLPQLLEKNHQARGGKAAWDAAKTVRVEGTFELGPGMVAPFTLVFVRPDKLRMDFEMQGMKASQVVDGEKGWHIMPFTGSADPAPSSADEIKSAKRMADFDGPLFDSDKKGYKLELLGKEDVDGTPAYKIKVTKDGEDSTLYLDAERFLEFKELRMVTTDQGGEMSVETTTGDYKPVGSLIIAHSIQSKIQGAPQGQAITITKVEINPNVPADTFKMPPPAPKPVEPPPAAPKPEVPPAPPAGGKP
jgi:outer membrane lipoprotein-sorting protein